MYIMTDIEFVNSLSEEIGDDYQKAKALAIEVPAYTLVHLRSIVARACEMLITQSGVKVKTRDLNQKIKSLYAKELIDNECNDWLHDLRMAGNKGAHPEYCNLSITDYRDIAIDALPKACKLLEKLYFPLKGIVAPKYSYGEPDSTLLLRDLCYASVMESDTSAQYEVGKVLKAQADVLHEEEIAEGKAKGLLTIPLPMSTKLHQKAFYWFKEACNDHPDAKFEYAIYLMGEVAGTEQNMDHGRFYLKSAAYEGSIDAKAAYGNLLFNGDDFVVQDYNEALKLLEEAAEHEHPSALADLGIAYHRGEGVEKDLSKSFEYIFKAAEAGFPNAQHNVGVSYFNGDGVEKDEELAFEWFEKAAEQEYEDAKIRLAEMYLSGSGCEVDKTKCKALYDEVCNVSRDPKTLYRCAMHYKDASFGSADYYKAGHFIQLAYEYAEETSEIRKLAYDASPAIVDKLRQEVQQSPDLRGNSDKVLVLWLFNENGHPCPDREKRCEKFHELTKEVSKTKRKNKVANAQVNGKIGRNNMCPCGSGQKYKNCCSKLLAE